MRRFLMLSKAYLIVFFSSFCLMVIELVAGRILAPYIGVSLYTWTSIIGVILAGIALGNYIGGKVADRFPSPLVLVIAFFLGSLATMAIIPATYLVTSQNWFGSLPIILNFSLKTACIFFLPAAILSIVTPVVIKLTLADLRKAGGTAGTIYAFSTVGSILGTFMTGFYFILWFGTRMIVWLVAGALILLGMLAWLFWYAPNKQRSSWNNLIMAVMTVIMLLSFGILFQMRNNWQVSYTRESNYYSIQVIDWDENVKALFLDQLVHSHIDMNNPTYLKYSYLDVFAEIVRYASRDKSSLSVLHLGGGGYSFPRYLEAVYPGSANDVVEIDPAVTEVAHEYLGLPRQTSIQTYNQDARLFLTGQGARAKYDFVIGDVFNDRSTPYHLTTLEFDRLVKTSMKEDGIYLTNILDLYENGRYLPAFIHTLQQAFNHVYLFSPGVSFENVVYSTFVIAATDRPVDLLDFETIANQDGSFLGCSPPLNEEALERYLSERNPVLLTDDYVPTDILVAQLFGWFR